MKNCITTLPITPNNKPEIGLIITAFFMDLLSKRTDNAAVLALNLNGSKIIRTESKSKVNGYLAALDAMNISPDFVWRDDLNYNKKWINDFLYSLKKRNHITKETKAIIKCDCGAIESLREAENLSVSRSLSINQGGKHCCKICNTEIKNYYESVYLFSFPSSFRIKNVFPAFYSKEINVMATKFENRKFLISRSRSSAQVVQIEDTESFFDVDFVWQMFLPILRRLGYPPVALVASNKNLMGCCLSLVLSQLIDNADIALIIPPYYLAPEKKHLKGEQYLSRYLTSQYGPKALRLLLASSINWTKKESVLDINLIELISKMAYRITGEKNKYELEGAFSGLDGQTVKRILAVARKTREVISSKELFGVV